MSALAGHDAHYLVVVWGVACGLGGTLLVALYTLYRRARSRRELEEAEAVLAEADAARYG